MAGPPKLYQGAAKVLEVATNIDLRLATEIQVAIDTPTQIVKSLTQGDVTNVTAAGFDVTIQGSDTQSVKPGVYKYQAVATIAGLPTQGRFFPNKVRIKDSVFVDDGCPRDYN